MELHLHEADIEAIAQRVASLLDEVQAGGAEDRWLTTQEAATHLGVAPRTLRLLIARRAIPYSQERPGARVFLLASDLDRWRADQSREPLD
jgi:excisionase family DNA binding protein